MVNPRSYDGPESRCYTPSFVEIGPPVPEKIFMVFTIYGHGGHLGHVTWNIYINFRSPFLRMLHMKFDWPSGSLKLCTDDGRTTEHGHHLSSPFEPSAQVS